MKKFVLIILAAFLMVGCAATKQVPMQYPKSDLPPIMKAGDTAKTDSFVTSESVEKSLAEQPKISNIWEDMDIKTVLQDFAAEADVNILWDETLEGTVTLKLENTPLEQALRMVLEPRGYVFKKLDDNHYLVGSGAPGTPSALALSQTETIITNRPAEEVAALLSPDLAPFVKTAKAGHTLSINAPADIAKRIKKDLETIDSSQPLVVVQVLVTEVRNTKGASSGIDWSKILNISASGVADLKRGIEWTYTGGLKGDLASSIQALAEQGSLKLRANPKIVVINGEEAQIEVLKEKYVTLESTSYNNNNPPYYYYYPRFEAKPIPSGVVLKVKPQISREGEITLTLETTVSDLDQSSDDSKLPVVQKRGAKTVVRVKSGDTVVIGGLHQELSRKIRKGLPILGRIPVLNFLFSKKEVEKQDVELVIFVTPNVLSP